MLRKHKELDRDGNAYFLDIEPQQSNESDDAGDSTDDEEENEETIGRSSIDKMTRFIGNIYW